MPEHRILVVGTTNDYIELLNRRFNGRLLFITEFSERDKRTGPLSDEDNEVFCDLSDREAVISDLRSFLAGSDYKISGVACFDCESMLMASYIAGFLRLPYPTPESVTSCRSKHESKRLWKENGVSCPESTLVRKAEDAIDFQSRLNRPVIIKPLTGSGSEFVYYCDGRLDCLRACFRLQKGISSRGNQRLYSSGSAGEPGIDPRVVYAAEEYIVGREYSCDFVLAGGNLDIIRIARKYPAPGLPVGTIMAYLLPAILPGGLDREEFRDQLYHACRSLGLERALGMVDFIVHHGRAYLLELTPRPGGDCLPELIRASSGFDILGAALDFSENKAIRIPPEREWTSLVGLRLPAESEGIIEEIDQTSISDDPRLISCNLRRQAGDSIVLPPDNYELWNLGTVIFRPTNPHQIERDCREIRGKLRLKMRAPSWATISTE